MIASHLPGEAAEAIIDLATGTTPTKPEVRQPDQSNPYEHPDAQRRFRVLTGTEELARALDYPWERWIVFLHPSQADWVSRSFNGPTRVQGSAGTGKTVVALHRAVHLARNNPEARVLLTTFSEPLAALLPIALIELAVRWRRRLIRLPGDKLGLQLMDMARIGLLYGLLMEGFKVL